MSNGRLCNLMSGYRVFCSCYPMLLSSWDGNRFFAVDRIPGIIKAAPRLKRAALVYAIYLQDLRENSGAVQ